MLKTIFKILLVIFLTTLTQIGGVIYLLSTFLNKKISFKKKYFKYFTFPILYLVFTFLVIPPLAKLNGRVPLPIFASTDVKPQTILTCVLNRHYVKPKLKKVVEDIGYEIGTIYYLDGNFPFFDGFSLLPHLSHNDGEKLDLTFIYKDNDGNYGNHPSFIGYGICEEPRKGEVNFPRDCVKQGFFQYNLLKNIINQKAKEKFELDEKKTIQLIQKLSFNPSIKKIFIEPHLKSRWGFGNNSKVRFHGCHAVRHDDHIHVQL